MFLDRKDLLTHLHNDMVSVLIVRFTEHELLHETIAFFFYLIKVGDLILHEIGSVVRFDKYIFHLNN